MSLYARRTDGLAFIPVRTGYVVDGGRQQEHITGRLARELFPALLPLLDGTRTIDEIADVLNLRAAYMRRVLVLLAQRDLVRLQATPTREDRSHPLRTFLRRSYPNPWADGVWRRLQASAVAVACGQPLTDLLVGLLRESEAGLLGRDEGAPDLTIAGTPDQTPDVLSIHVTPTAVSIGPPTRPGDCAPAGTAPGGCDPALAGVAAGVIAGRALRLIGGHNDEPETTIDVHSPPAGPVRVVRRSAHGRIDQFEPCRHPARHYLTERRLPLWRSSRPLVRAMSRILGDLHRAPAAGHAGAVRTYLLGDLHDGHRSYFVDPVAGDLVELADPVRHTCDTPTLVLTHDSCAEGRLLVGDTGLVLAQLADAAHAVGWRIRARAIDTCEQLDLDPDREQAAVVAELAPVQPRARPARRTRPLAGNHFGVEPIDGARLTRLIIRALARVGETWADGQPRCVMYARGVTGMPFGSTRWIGEPDQQCDLDSSRLESHLSDRGLAPAALLLFVADTAEDRQQTKVAMAAATVRLMVASAGMGAVLLARLPEQLLSGYASNRRALYGCALGSRSTAPFGPVSSQVMW